MKRMPRLRLFGKLLIAFWVTFFVALHGVWLLTQLLSPDIDPFNARYARRAAPAQMEALATVLRSDGADAAAQMLSRWPEDDRRWYRIVPMDELPAMDDDPDAETRTLVVSAPDGSAHAIINELPPRRRLFLRPGPFNIPPPVIAMGAGGGLVFAAVMAWYLTRPVRRLRQGFDRLARGELGYRLTPSMGRRRDEIADLARDFDAMANRLEDLVASKQQLLHEVSHELRSPLARVQVAVGLARLGPDRVPAALDRIEEETARLDAMIGELLTLARAEHHSPEFNKRVELGELVGAIVADADFEASGGGVSVELVEAHASPVFVRGNAELIRRAIGNVVRNGVQHTPSGSRVRVTLEHDASTSRARVTVRDDGPGVPEERLRSIFEPYVRATNAGGVVGFGLGLAISKRAVEAHGGTIEARNTTPGLSVTIELPIEPGD